MSNIRYYTDGEQATADTLNRPLKDLEALMEIRNASEYWALVETRRGTLVSSGFETGSNGSINFDSNNSTAGTFTNSYSCPDGTHYQEENTLNFNIGDIYNIGGHKITLAPTKRPADGDTSQCFFIFDDASDNPNELSRMQSSFIEGWVEKISDKDFIYPYGAVQYGKGSWEGITLKEGEFTGKDDYSLYGHWAESGSYIGKGIEWSSLSLEQKRKFISKNYNNIWVEDGEIFQFRYRIRTENHAYFNRSWSFDNGDYDWIAINSKEHPDFDNNYVLRAWGARTDRPTGNDNNIYQLASKDLHQNYVSAKNRGFYDNACYISPGAATGYDDFSSSVEGFVYAIPIVTTYRKNKGVYHESLNPLGLSQWKNKSYLEYQGNNSWTLFNKYGTAIETASNKMEALNLIFGRSKNGTKMSVRTSYRAYIANVASWYDIPETDSFIYNAPVSTNVVSLWSGSVNDCCARLVNNIENSTSSHSTFLTREMPSDNPWIDIDSGSANILKKFVLHSEPSWSQNGAYGIKGFDIYGSDTGEFNGEETLLFNRKNETSIDDSINLVDDKFDGYKIGNDYYGVEKTQSFRSAWEFNVDNSTSFRYYRIKQYNKDQFGFRGIEFFDSQDKYSVFNPLLNVLKDSDGHYHYPKINTSPSANSNANDIYQYFFESLETGLVNETFDLYVDNKDGTLTSLNKTVSISTENVNNISENILGGLFNSNVRSPYAHFNQVGKYYYVNKINYFNMLLEDMTYDRRYICIDGSKSSEELLNMYYDRFRRNQKDARRIGHGKTMFKFFPVNAYIEKDGSAYTTYVNDAANRTNITLYGHYGSGTTKGWPEKFLYDDGNVETGEYYLSYGDEIFIRFDGDTKIYHLRLINQNYRIGIANGGNSNIQNYFECLNGQYQHAGIGTTNYTLIGINKVIPESQKNYGYRKYLMGNVDNMPQEWKDHGVEGEYICYNENVQREWTTGTELSDFATQSDEAGNTNILNIMNTCNSFDVYREKSGVYKNNTDKLVWTGDWQNTSSGHFHIGSTDHNWIFNRDEFVDGDYLYTHVPNMIHGFDLSGDPLSHRAITNSNQRYILSSNGKVEYNNITCYNKQIWGNAVVDSKIAFHKSRQSGYGPNFQNCDTMTTDNRMYNNKSNWTYYQVKNNVMDYEGSLYMDEGYNGIPSGMTKSLGCLLNDYGKYVIGVFIETVMENPDVDNNPGEYLDTQAGINVIGQTGVLKTTVDGTTRYLTSCFIPIPVVNKTTMKV